MLDRRPWNSAKLNNLVQFKDIDGPSPPAKKVSGLFSSSSLFPAEGEWEEIDQTFFAFCTLRNRVDDRLPLLLHCSIMAAAERCDEGEQFCDVVTRRNNKLLGTTLGGCRSCDLWSA